MKYGKIVDFGNGNLYHEINGWVNGSRQMFYVKKQDNIPRFIDGVKIEE